MGSMAVLAILGLGALLFLGAEKEDKVSPPTPTPPRPGPAPGTPPDRGATPVPVLSDEEFGKFIGWKGNEKPGKKLVEFCDATAPGCNEQSNYTNTFAKNNPSIKVVRMYPESVTSFDAYNINQLPTIIVFDGYNEKGRAVGIQNESQLKALTKV